MDEAMRPEKEQLTPLAAAAAVLSFRTSSSDEGDTKKRQLLKRPSFCRRRLRAWCWWAGAAVLTALLVIVVVGYTVYKVREPEMVMNAVAIKEMTVTPPNVSLAIMADVSVKNRNPTTFYFDRSLTSLYYHDDLMGKAYGPPGRASGRRTYRTNVTLVVVTDKLLSNPQLIEEVSSGVLEMNSSTEVGGHVMVFGLFRHHVDVLMNCTALVGVVNQTILRQSCTQRVWI